MNQHHRCESNEWWGYQPPGSSPLLCDQFAASSGNECRCLSAPTVPEYHPVCDVDGRCPNGGTCVESRCYYNSPVNGSSEAFSTKNDKLQSSQTFPAWWGFIPSDACADFLTTNYTFDGPSNLICWSMLEGIAAPLTESIAIGFPPPFNLMGLAMEQADLYMLWNTAHLGERCENFVDDIRTKFGEKELGNLTQNEQCELKNDATKMCQAMGFKNSDLPDCGQSPPFPPKPPVPPPRPGYCGKDGDQCLLAGEQGRCVKVGDDLRCDLDKGLGKKCRVDGVLGLCSDGPGPMGSCGVCTPLDAPLCSLLKDVVKFPPRGCDDAPHWDDPRGDARQACAPLSKGDQKAWQCH